jgi:hypothetical protein
MLLSPSRAPALIGLHILVLDLHSARGVVHAAESQQDTCHALLAYSSIGFAQCQGGRAQGSSGGL